MFERDFIKREILQVTQLAIKLLKSVLGLIAEEKHDEALQEIHGIYSNFYGLNSQLLQTISAKGLIAMLTPDDQNPEAAKLLVLAELQKLEGDVHLAEERPGEAQLRYIGALSMFLETALQTGVTRAGENENLIADLAAALKPDNLPPYMQLDLLKFYELEGKFGAAEDELLELIDRGNKSPEIVVEGLGFYRRLLQLSDEELKLGEAYRDELEEGLKELKMISNNQPN